MQCYRPALPVIATLLLCLSTPHVAASEEPAQLVAGPGTRILDIDGLSRELREAPLDAGLHTLRFESIADVEPLPGRERRIHEVCEARFRARSGAVYVLAQQVIATRGRRMWHHQLSSFVFDEERDRATGECVCRTARLGDR